MFSTVLNIFGYIFTILFLDIITVLQLKVFKYEKIIRWFKSWYSPLKFWSMNQFLYINLDHNNIWI